MPRLPFSIRTFSVAAPLIAPALLALPGCNIVGPAIFFIHGPDKVPAAFELDENKSTVFFIDDRVPLANRAEKEAMGAAAEGALLEEKAVKDVISSRGLQAAIARERFGKPMGIAEIGKAMNAQVVVYVRLDAFSLTTDGQTYTPLASMRVKVIDVATKARVFPPSDQAGADPWHVVSIQLPGQQGSPPRAETPDGAKARQELARLAGLALARTFFKHDAPSNHDRIDGGS